MVVVLLVVVARNSELKHINVHTDLGCELNRFEHTLLALRALVALTAIAAGGLMAVLDRYNILHRNILAVNTRVQPAAAVLTEIFVYRKKHRARVVARNDAAALVTVYVEYIVKLCVLGIRHVKPEVLHKSEAEAALCLRVIGYGDIAALGHHHTKILF